MDTNFPAALPHGPLEEVFPDIFIVTGRFKMAPLVTITRNMIVVREGRSLTLMNSVRLSEAGEAELARLGTVERLIKLGPFHGIDDPYTVHRFRPTLYALPKARHGLGITTDVELTAASLPLADAELFTFEATQHAEAAILVHRHGGVLLTCDSVQNNVTLKRLTPLAKVGALAMGFRCKAGIGKPWRKAMAMPGGPPLSAEFERLLSLPFRHLISAHGPPLRETAREDLRATVTRLWPER